MQKMLGTIVFDLGKAPSISARVGAAARRDSRRCLKWSGAAAGDIGQLRQDLAISKNLRLLSQPGENTSSECVSRTRRSGVARGGTSLHAVLDQACLHLRSDLTASRAS